MTNKVYFKYPSADCYYSIFQEYAPLTYTSIKDIGNTSGFIIAPFFAEEKTPIVLLQNAKRYLHALPIPYREVSSHISTTLWNEIHLNNKNYIKAFSHCHKALCNNQVQKIVLARTAKLQHNVKSEAHLSLFLKACQANPNCYVCLFSTTITGAWITITPELLLENNKDNYHTVALAGTLPFMKDLVHSSSLWPSKHIKEQQLVKLYIQDTLKDLGIKPQEGKLFVKQMHNLLHLCTDIYFKLPKNIGLSYLLDALHPTPAIGGLPKQAAVELIRLIEKEERLYYAGFVGEYQMQNRTALYVTLRCAQLEENELIYHAGGGLLRESLAEEEWEETCKKIATIASIIH